MSEATPTWDLECDEEAREAWAEAMGSASLEAWKAGSPGLPVDGLFVDTCYWSGPDRDLGRTGTGWEIWAEVHGTDSDEVSVELESLRRWDPDGIWLRRSEGEEELSATAFESLLGAEAGVAFGGGLSAPMAVRRTLEILRSLSTPVGVSGCLGLDPFRGGLSGEARIGSIEETVRRTVDLLAGVAPRWSLFGLDLTPVQAMGGDAALQVTYALGAGAESLRALASAGAADGAPGPVELIVPTGRDVGLQIAKVRALRLVWRLLLGALGLDGAPDPRIHGRTAWRTQTVYSADANRIRGTLEAAAAVLGGCDALSVRPWDDVLCAARGERVDRVSTDWALATQRLLASESHLGRIDDPARGSWYLETLTDQIARSAWKRFLEIEERGGLTAVLDDGSFRRQIEVAAEQRRRDLAAGRVPIVGLSAFPDPEERLSAPIGPAQLRAPGAGEFRDAEELEVERRSGEMEPSP